MQDGLRINISMKTFNQYITEARYGHTLWIDPKGNVYDMNDRKEIKDPKGFAYTHYDWVAANFKKYFGKAEPKGKVVYDTPHLKGWARVKNNRDEIDVQVDPRKLNRSQKKVLRDIVDSGSLKRPLYIDAWTKNKTSRANDKAYNSYEEIVDYLSEEGGAGEEGTKKLVKKYKKDTPGQ